MANPSTSETVQRQFGAVAAAYATSAVHASGRDLELLIEAAALDGTESALDLGAGAGHTAFALARGAREVIGVDLTAEMVGVATELATQRAVGNVRFQQADAAALPFADGSFDVVTSRYSAHHYGEPSAALNEARRVLRPGGRFLLVDTVAPEDPALDTFLNAFEFLRDPSHVRDWRASEWLRICERAGFEARVRERLAVNLDGSTWTARMRTPASRVAIIRELFAAATGPQRAAFDIRDEPWGFSLPVVLIEGTAG